MREVPIRVGMILNWAGKDQLGEAKMFTLCVTPHVNLDVVLNRH